MSAVLTALVALAALAVTFHLLTRLDDARQEQIVAAELTSAVYAQSALESRTGRDREVSPALRGEGARIRGTMRAGLERWRILDRQEGNPDKVARRIDSYNMAVDAEHAARRAGRPEVADEIAKSRVDPGFAAVRGILSEVSATDADEAEGMATVTRAGVTLVVILALGLLATLWRRERTVAAALRSGAEDLTDARDEARAASRAKSEFVANMSHEIRTPMNGVIGMTELLLDTPLDSEQRDYARTVRSSGESLLTVVNDILDFSRIEAGKLELDPTDFELRSTVEDVCQLASVSAHAKGLELDCSIDPRIPELVHADHVRLRQIMSNLIGNSVKFTNEGEVFVEVVLENDLEGQALLRFEVRDSGIGIDPSKISGLFDSFSQADGSTSRHYGGTGLGLAISKQLAEMMGGEIGAESKPWSGSRFWFTAPVGVPSQQPREPAVPGLDGRRVILVTARRTGRGVLSDHLAALGARAEPADGAAEALKLMRSAARGEHPYALVVIDSSLGEGDPVDLTKAVRSDSVISSTPIIFVTSSREEQHQAVAAGSDGGVAKPVRRPQLREAIVDVLNDGRALTRSNAPAAVAGNHLTGGRLLVVEDNPINQAVLVQMLRKRGYEAEVAGDGVEALEKLKEADYAAVLMDCQLPRMDGYEATAELRRRGEANRTPVIAVTAHAMSADRDRCLAAGMDDYVVKPVSPADLDAALERWVPHESRLGVERRPSLVEAPARG